MTSWFEHVPGSGGTSSNMEVRRRIRLHGRKMVNVASDMLEVSPKVKVVS